jgi:hypothetical protein
MFRWARRVLLVIALVVLVGGVVIALTTRPSLDRARNDVEQQWTALRPSLDARYALLGRVNNAARSTAGPAEPLVTDIDGALATWRTSSSASVTDQVRAANDLEALGRRLGVTIAASSRFRTAAPVTAAARSYTTAPFPARAAAFTDAVRKYESTRGGSFRRLVAGTLGYDSIPALDASSSA